MLGGLGDGRAAGVGGVICDRDLCNSSVPHPTVCDKPILPGPSQLVSGYCILAAVRRVDGIPVPFESDEARFLTQFKHGCTEYYEAVFAY